METRPQPVGLSNPEVQKELNTHLAGLKDMGPGWEDPMASAFLSRIEGRITEIVDQRVAERLRGVRSRDSIARLAITSGVAIPLLAIASASGGGLPGVIVVIGGLVALNWKELLP